MCFSIIRTQQDSVVLFSAMISAYIADPPSREHAILYSQDRTHSLFFVSLIISITTYLCL